MRHARISRVAAWLMGLGALPVGLWIGIDRTSWLGPLLADAARSVVGPRWVARAEDLAYDAEDRWNQWRHGGDAPEPLWQVPPSATSGSAVPATSAPIGHQDLPGELARSPALRFPPYDLSPMHDRDRGAGDGVWIGMPDSRAPNDRPRLFKTQLHPDDRRPWTTVAIVAVDLARVELMLEPGLWVPEATEPEARFMPRPGLIPAEQQPRVIAAFNGGFKTIHGRLGMHARGVTLVRAQPWGCTLARTGDGRLLLGTWSALPGDSAEFVWWRQTPQCLVENGEFGDGVLLDANQNWGCAVNGGTFIRRSAVGLNADRTILYYGLGESVSAAGIARALLHAGASAVAQLDVNWSLPKFLMFEPARSGPGRLVPQPLDEGLEFSKDEYVREPSSRDFFYILRKDAPVP